MLLSFIRTVLIEAVYSIMLHRLHNDPFVFVMDFPTNDNAFVLSSFHSHTPLIFGSIVSQEGSSYLVRYYLVTWSARAPLVQIGSLPHFVFSSFIITEYSSALLTTPLC